MLNKQLRYVKGLEKVHMEILTKRLRLVVCTPENYSHFATQYDMGPHINMLVAELEKEPEQLGWGVWMIVDRNDGTTVGDAGFKGRPTNNRVVEIGYGILTGAQKQGYGTEAVNGLIDWAFQTGEVTQVIAECKKDNVASIKVLEKVGMHQTREESELLFWSLDKEELGS